MLKFAIIGFGGLGKSHFHNVSEVTEMVGDIQLTALCDVEDSAFRTKTDTNLGEDSKETDLSAYHLYNDVEEMLDKEELDFVITALPTVIHEKIAVQVMNRGIHVFSEKPMALTAEQAENMLKAAKDNHVKLMIGQCLRFWPQYQYLKELIDSGKYGKVVRAHFNRISGLPLWSWQHWMEDEKLSGGAALDMHVHDVDFINWAFGLPRWVSSQATDFRADFDSISTLYHYDDKVVTATCDWGFFKGFPFIANYMVRFEKAGVVMEKGVVTVYEDDNKFIAEIPEGNSYAREVAEFITCIREDRESTVNPAEASCTSLKLAIAEKVSARTGEKVDTSAI